ncbi:hypothetical protein [Campylobacter concisus]|uniref:CR-type domain-containing protein n=1 Tax=Campylobacter concisus (strain 13826) TaxID=360104 RepID=A7ZG72_CAMC1|nr:hypothetical protein [Campylobacter concisus]EAT97338.1 hypothetical protein CCC13826_0903 [Campylobacter concisus 13826]
MKIIRQYIIDNKVVFEKEYSYEQSHIAFNHEFVTLYIFDDIEIGYKLYLKCTGGTILSTYIYNLTDLYYILDVIHANMSGYTLQGRYDDKLENYNVLIIQQELRNGYIAYKNILVNFGEDEKEWNSKCVIGIKLTNGCYVEEYNRKQIKNKLEYYNFLFRIVIILFFSLKSCIKRCINIFSKRHKYFYLNVTLDEIYNAPLNIRFNAIVARINNVIEKKEKQQVYQKEFFYKKHSNSSSYGQSTYDNSSSYGQSTYDNSSSYGQSTYDNSSSYGQSTKETICSKCGGSGKIETTCSSCGGYGWQTCPNCNGNGTLIKFRPTYDGLGEQYTETCPKCQGSGKENCFKCNYSGKIEITCQHCNGSGYEKQY